MGRTDFLLEVIRTHDAAAIASLIALVILGRFLGNRRSTWIVVLLDLLAEPLGYVFSGHNIRRPPTIAAGSDWRDSIAQKEITRDSAGLAGTCLPSWHRAVHSCANVCE